MENTQYQEKPSIIYFVEDMTPEYLEYIDSCKERAQSDSAYWQDLKESMSRGMINMTQLDDRDIDTDTDTNTQSDADTQYESNVSAESIRSLLEYQIKMLENMNYAIDMLTERCDELTKYCSKLAKRLKKYSCSGVSNPIDVSGIINSNNGIPSVNKVNNAPVQNKSLQSTQSSVSIRNRIVPIAPTQQIHASAHAHENALTFTGESSVSDEVDNDDNDDFTETNTVNTVNPDVKQVEL